MEAVFLLVHLRLVQLEKRSFGLPQAGRLTTVVAGTTGRLRAGVIRINRVGIVVRFAGVNRKALINQLNIYLIVNGWRSTISTGKSLWTF